MVKISDSNAALPSKSMLYYATVPRFLRESSGIRRNWEKHKLRKMWLTEAVAAVTWLQGGLAKTLTPQFNKFPSLKQWQCEGLMTTVPECAYRPHGSILQGGPMNDEKEQRYWSGIMWAWTQAQLREPSQAIQGNLFEVQSPHLRNHI